MGRLRKAMWIFMLYFLTLGLACYVVALEIWIPARSNARSEAANRFPNISLQFTDVSFDFSNRSVRYDLQLWVSTATFPSGLLFNFRSPMAQSFDIRLTPESSSPHERNYFKADRKAVIDLAQGLSELYPYDSYSVSYDIYGYTEVLLDLNQTFPYVFAYMKYPESLYWQIECHASSVVQYTRNAGMFYLWVNLTITKILGYSSMVSLFPTWAGNVVLASSLFLVEKKNRKKMPKIADRLTVYISLFVFIPMFAYLISSQIPTKWLLSTAEAFLMALLSSTAVFTVFTILSGYAGESRDLSAITICGVSCLLFSLIDPLYFLWYKIMIGEPWYEPSRFGSVSSWFLDLRMIPWIVLILSVYAIAYLRIYHNFSSSRLAISFVGAVVFFITAPGFLHDPTLVIISTSYVCLSFPFREMKTSLVRIVHRIFLLPRRFEFYRSHH